MTQAEFVQALREVVLEGLGAEVVSAWSSPPGRLRSSERNARAKWVNELTDQDREQVKRLADDAARAAVFGLFCVLDGSRMFEDGDRGELELRYLRRGTVTTLASSTGKVLPLHELI